MPRGWRPRRRRGGGGRRAQGTGPGVHGRHPGEKSIPNFQSLSATSEAIDYLITKREREGVLKHSFLLEEFFLLPNHMQHLHLRPLARKGYTFPPANGEQNLIFFFARALSSAASTAPTRRPCPTPPACSGGPSSPPT